MAAKKKKVVSLLHSGNTYIFKQNNTDRTYYIQWKRTGGSDLDHYAVVWAYYSRDKKTGKLAWFEESETSVKNPASKALPTSLYTAPDIASQIKVTVWPVAEKDKKNNPKFSFKKITKTKTVGVKKPDPVDHTPATPSTPTVIVNGTTLTAYIDGITDTNTKSVDFQIVKGNNTQAALINATPNKDAGKAVATWKNKMQRSEYYRVRARGVYDANTMSVYSSFTESYTIGPATPTITTIDQVSSTELQVNWSEVSGATSYTVQHTTKESYFDSGGEVSSVDSSTTHASLTGLTAGTKYYVRLKAKNSADQESGWSTVKYRIVGTIPAAPTTWSEQDSIILGNAARIYWVHNSEDESIEKAAKIYYAVISVNGTKIYETTITRTNTDTESSIKKYEIDTTPGTVAWESGAKLKWKVKTKGVYDGGSDGGYGPWSTEREITVYERPTISADIYGPDPESEDVPGDRIYYYEGAADEYLYLDENNIYISDMGISVSIYEISILPMVYYNDEYIGSATVDLWRRALKISSEIIPGGVFQPTDTIQIYERDTRYIPLSDITSFPFYLKAHVQPITQHITAFSIAVIATESYRPLNPVGERTTISADETIFSDVLYYTTDEAVNDITYEFNASNIDLEPGIEYQIKMITNMDSGLSAEEDSLTFTPTWEDLTYDIYADLTYNEEDYTMSIRPYCVYVQNDDEYYVEVEDISLLSWTAGDGTYSTVIDDIEENTEDIIIVNDDTGESYETTVVETTVTVVSDESPVGSMRYRNNIPEPSEPTDDESEIIDNLVPNMKLAVYRIESDNRYTEIATMIDNDYTTTTLDKFPNLDAGRYRVVATNTITGAISFGDVNEYVIDESSIIIQWNVGETYAVSDAEYTIDDYDGEGGDTYTETNVESDSGFILVLPYNVDVADTYSPDVEMVEYIGRSHPVSYYGTQLGQTSQWSSAIPYNDTETITLLRQLARYQGDCYVREPSGTGYWAHVVPSFSINHMELIIPITLDITRVDGGDKIYA